MGLNWIAAHEMEVLLLPEDAANHEGLLSRQKSVITSLYEIATAYGKNSPACIGGTRDFIGCALGGQHALVMASEKKVLTKEQEQTLATSILGKSLKLLSRENLPSYWEVLRYLCFAESSLQKNYSDFIAKQKEGFLKRCAVEGISEEIANNVFLVVENTDDAIYPIHYHPDSTRLCRLFLAMEANQLEQFSGDIALETVLERAKNLVASQLLANSQLKALLKEYEHDESETKLANYFIEVWLQQAQSESQPLQELGDFFKGKEFENKPFIRNTFLHALFLTKKEVWKQTNSEQALWLDTLVHQDIIHLMRARWHVGLNNQKLLEELILGAIEEGITANLNLQNHFFENKDFRYFDFSGVNLNGSTFKNCHLPLSGTNLQCDTVSFENCSLPNVNKNVTEKEGLEQFRRLMISKVFFSPLVIQFYMQRVTSHETLMEYNYERDSLLLVATKSGRADVVKAIMESEYCGNKWVENEWQCGNSSGNSLLMEAVYEGFVGIVAYILSNQYCTAELLECTNVAGDTVLSAALSSRWHNGIEITKLILQSEHCTSSLLENVEVDSVDDVDDDGNSIDGNSNNAVSLARRFKNFAAILLLLQSQHCTKKLFEDLSEEGNTLLIEALHYNKGLELAKVILDSPHCTSEYLEKIGVNNWNALTTAVLGGHTDFALALLENKLCTQKLLGQTDVKNNTLLMMAAALGQTEVFKAILNNKHCPPELLEQINSNNYTAETIAEHYGHMDIISAIREAKHKDSMSVDASWNEFWGFEQPPEEKSPRSDDDQESSTVLGKRSRDSFFSAQPLCPNNQENEPPEKRPNNQFNS